MKTIAGLRKTKYRGIEKVGWAFTSQPRLQSDPSAETDRCGMKQNTEPKRYDPIKPARMSHASRQPRPIQLKSATSSTAC